MISRFVICTCLVTCGGVSAPALETTSASVATFDRYSTFSFESPVAITGGYRESERTLPVQDRMTSLVAKALADKGYVNVPSDADLVVVLGAGEAEVTKTRRLTKTATGEREEFILIPAGALVIDAYDARTHARVWHGVATGAVRAHGIDEERLAQVVDGMMGSFPRARRSR